eukprot:SAG25_NODE_544_length_7044_cov_3.670122_5_plen_77_part_00
MTGVYVSPGWNSAASYYRCHEVTEMTVISPTAYNLVTYDSTPPRVLRCCCCCCCCCPGCDVFTSCIYNIYYNIYDS